MKKTVKVKTTSDKGIKRINEGDGCIVAVSDGGMGTIYVEGNFTADEMIATACGCVIAAKKALIESGEPAPLVDIKLILAFEKALKGGE